MVIVDAPPILSVADTRIVASLTDALILVLRSGVTQREAAMEAYQLIQEDGLTLLGTVLTDYDLSSDRRRQYYYDYGDHQSEHNRRKARGRRRSRPSSSAGRPPPIK
jgi:protein-tyrosine kinase